MADQEQEIAAANPLPPYTDHRRLLEQAWGGRRPSDFCPQSLVDALITRCAALEEVKASNGDLNCEEISKELCNLCFDHGASITTLVVAHDYLIPILSLERNIFTTVTTDFDVSSISPRVERVNRATVSLAALDLLLLGYGKDELLLLMHGMKEIFPAPAWDLSVVDIVLLKAAIAVADAGISSVVLGSDNTVYSAMQIINMFFARVSIRRVLNSRVENCRSCVAYSLATTAFSVMKTLEDKIVTGDGLVLNYYDAVETYLNIDPKYPAVMVQAAGNLFRGQRLCVLGKMMSSFDLLRMSRRVQLEADGADVARRGGDHGKKNDDERIVLMSSYPWIPWASAAALAAVVGLSAAISRLKSP